MPATSSNVSTLISILHRCPHCLIRTSALDARIQFSSHSNALWHSATLCAFENFAEAAVSLRKSLTRRQQ